MPVAQPGAPKCPPFASLCECNKNHYYYCVHMLTGHKIPTRIDWVQNVIAKREKKKKEHRGIKKCVFNHNFNRPLQAKKNRFW